MDLLPFKIFLKENSGLFFNEDNTSTLETAVKKRMEETGIVNSAIYLNLINNNKDEFNHLISLLTINETYFFREPGHFNVLMKHLIPELLTKINEGQKIKILSAGCSTGEEPYTIVMALMEKFGSDITKSFSVIGADIDFNVIRFAKKGVYRKISFRAFENSLKNKYFDETAEGEHKIKDFVKTCVQFLNMSLKDDFETSALKDVDIIFYRNVSIYFKSETQKLIFQNLSNLLKPDGYMIVSSTETFLHDLGILSLIELDGTFLYKKKIITDVDKTEPSGKIEDHRLFREQSKPVNRLNNCSNILLKHKKKLSEHRLKVTVKKPAIIIPAGNNTKPEHDYKTIFERALSLAKDKKYDEALKNIEILITGEPGFIKAYALKAGILINLKQYDEAENVCLHMFEMDQWNLEAYLLSGLISKIMKDEEKMLKRFKEALYLEPSCWIAHFYMAEIYNCRKESSHALREYGIVIKLLENGSTFDHGLTFFPISFHAEQMIHLCGQNIKRLKNI